MRYHRNVLRGEKDRVYFKMVFGGLLALFTLGIKSFLFPFIFKKILSKDISHGSRKVQEVVAGLKMQLDVFYLFLFISGQSDKPVKSYAKNIPMCTLFSHLLICARPKMNCTMN